MYRTPNMPTLIKNYQPRLLVAALFYLTGLSILMLSFMAQADEQDPINIIAGISRLHDNNLFRRSTDEQSENITTTYAGIRINKPYAMQRFELDFTVTDFKYQKYNFLDFTAKDYKAAWLWALTPYLTGTLSAERKQVLNDFKDYTNYTVQNIRTTENQHFEADFSPHGNWHLLGGFTRTDQTNSQTFNAESDYSSDAIDAGLKYVFRSGNSITLMGHERNGTYKNRTLNPVFFYDNGFDETEMESKLNWMLSGKSKVNMRLAYINRDHDHFNQRDYSGALGRAEYTWTPTGRVQVSVAASRDLSSYQTIYSSYTRTDRLMIAPVYAVTSKITARATASVSQRKFLGDGLVDFSRSDTERQAGVNLDWAPYRSVSIGASLLRSSRNSDLPGSDFTDTTAGLSANLFF